MLLQNVLKNLLATDSGRKHPSRVVGRFAYLQLRRRFGPSPFTFTTPTGTCAMVERGGDFSSIAGLYYLDMPDLEETAFACHTLRPHEVFWDIGANLGFWSLLLVGRGSEAHAFEPTPLTFQNQCKQFAAQLPPHRDRLHGHNVALSAQSGKMRFVVDRGQANYLLKNDEAYGGQVAEVDVRTVDAFRGQAPAPNFIKIDVEGWTLPVLEGARETLGNPDLHGLVIETFRFADGASAEMRAVEDLLAGYGFRPFAYDPSNRQLRPLMQLNEGRQNTVYARDDEALRARLRSADPVTCFGDRF